MLSHSRSELHIKNSGGREVDSLGHKAGKGPLIQSELSGTLGVSQDQTLFAGRNKKVTAFTTEMTPKVDDTGAAFSLRGRDSKDPQSVVYSLQGGGTTSQSGNGCALSEDVQFTLNGLDVHGVAAVDVSNSTEDEWVTGPLQACSFKNVNSNNVIRTRKD